MNLLKELVPDCRNSIQEKSLALVAGRSFAWFNTLLSTIIERLFICTNADMVLKFWIKLIHQWCINL